MILHFINCAYREPGISSEKDSEVPSEGQVRPEIPESSQTRSIKTRLKVQEDSCFQPQEPNESMAMIAGRISLRRACLPAPSA